MDNNKWVLAKIKKYEKLKGDSLDGWQECTEEKHKSMWEAYNLAYGQILSDLNELIEYIPEVQEETQIGKTPIQWWNNLSDFQKSCHLDNWQNPTNKDIEIQWCDVKDSLPKTVTSSSVKYEN